MAVDQEGLSGDLGAKNITLTLSRKLRYAVTHTGAVQFVLKQRNKNGFRPRETSVRSLRQARSANRW